LSNEQVAQILEDFVQGGGSAYSWDDFTLEISCDEENLEQIRIPTLQGVCSGASPRNIAMRKDERPFATISGNLAVKASPIASCQKHW
jgi:hypothetical protein